MWDFLVVECGGRFFIWLYISRLECCVQRDVLVLFWGLGKKKFLGGKFLGGDQEFVILKVFLRFSMYSLFSRDISLQERIKSLGLGKFFFGDSCVIFQLYEFCQFFIFFEFWYFQI